MYRLRSLVAVAAVLLSLAPNLAGPRVAAGQTPITLKLATIVGVDHPFSTSAVKFREVAEAKSHGRLKIEVYPAGQLAKNGTVMLEGMQLGTVDIGANDTPTIGAKWDPKFLMPDVPFLFQSREQVWKVVDGPIGKELIQRLEPLGAKGFCFGGGWGFRNVLSNKRAVYTAADMKGQTIRVPPVPTLVETMKVIDESMVVACAQHRQDELKQEAEAFALMKAKGVQINEVKDIREFQERAQPVWKFLEAKVGKEFFDRVVVEARAAAK